MTHRNGRVPRLRGEVVVVSGGGSGLGRAIALGAPHGINTAYPLSKVAANHFTRRLAADAAAHDEDGPRSSAELVEETGGDSPEKPAKLVLELCDTSRDELTGEFLWIRDGIQEPQETW